MKEINSWFACRQLLLALISTAILLSGCTKHAAGIASLNEKVWNACPMPLYPAQALALRKEGVVNAVLHVNSDGKVVSVETAGDKIFFDSTVKALNQCKFPPGTSNKVSRTATFKLNGAASVEPSDVVNKDVDKLLGDLSPAKASDVQNADIHEYANEIKSAIERNFYDDPSFKGKRCTLRIHLAPDGLLLSLTAVSGDAALCQGAIDGAKEAHFPVPPNQAVYDVFKNALLDFSL